MFLYHNAMVQKQSQQMNRTSQIDITGNTELVMSVLYMFSGRNSYYMSSTDAMQFRLFLDTSHAIKADITNMCKI